MRGKKTSEKRNVDPDAKYKSTLVTRLINRSMVGGKKSTARKNVYKAMEKASKQVDAKPIKILEQAVANAKPIVEIRPRRVGGASYSIPFAVSPERQETLAIRWLVEAARGHDRKQFSQALAQEIVNAFNGTGSVIKKRENIEKMAESNRAFAHFRW